MQGFSRDNPYTLKKVNITREELAKEDAYIWQRRLDLCGIQEIYSKEREDELFNMMEDRMQQLYFEDAPRTPVLPENNPPWKYTPV